MIVRLIVVDPRPRKAGEDIIVYQVPEKSRAYGLLVEVLANAGVEFVELPSTRPAGRKKKE